MLKLFKYGFYFLMICSFKNTFSQSSADSLTAAKKMQTVLSAANNRFTKASYDDSVMNALTESSRTDTALKSALSQYNLFGLEHRKRSLQWNLTSTIIIFWSVIFLVLCGIIFAGIQFYSSLYSKNKPGDPVQSLATNLEANMQGIKVSSPVLGVIILMISMLFFYLYLKYVYPITEIF